MENLLAKYYDKTNWSNDVLNIIWSDIESLNDPYDPEVKYAGRGDSRNFTWSEFLIPELGINPVFYIHDKMYQLVKNKVCGYTIEFANCLMDNLMEIEGFVIMDDVYYFFTDLFN